MDQVDLWHAAFFGPKPQAPSLKPQALFGCGLGRAVFLRVFVVKNTYGFMTSERMMMMRTPMMILGRMFESRIWMSP